MAEGKFDVVFAGVLRAGVDPDGVKSNVARLFKTEVAAIDHLFCGKRFLIKGGVDRQTALKYRAAMQQAGAVCEIRDASPAEGREIPPTSAVTAPPAAPQGTLAAADLAPPGSILVERQACERPVFDLSALSLAAVGVDLIDQGVVDRASLPDISALQMEPAGVDLVAPRATPEFVLTETTAMSIAAPGADLVARPLVAPPPLPDTSAFTLDPPGQILADRPASAPPPPPETGGLSLDPRPAVSTDEA